MGVGGLAFLLKRDSMGLKGRLSCAVLTKGAQNAVRWEPARRQRQVCVDRGRRSSRHVSAPLTAARTVTCQRPPALIDVPNLTLANPRGFRWAWGVCNCECVCLCVFGEGVVT